MQDVISIGKGQTSRFYRQQGAWKSVILSMFVLAGCQETKAPSSANFMEVTRVVDGDTFWVDNGSRKGLKIRLIGVDAPETRPSGHKEVGYYGEESKEYLRRLLQSRPVRLEFDVDSTDRYGRTLAYAYLEDGTFVNAKLIKDGYAKVLTISPNVAHADEFARYQRAARRLNLGLWGE